MTTAEDGRKRPIPGIERYSAFPRVEQSYRRDFSDAKKILSHPSMPEDIITRAQDLSIAYASSRAEQLFSLEDQIKAMSVRILQAGDEIITERDWNHSPEGTNFAWQLRGTESKNAKSLRLSAKTGKPIDLIKFILGESRKQQIQIAKFADIPDVLIGASLEQTMKELMFDVFVDLSTKLGFISDREDFHHSPLVKKEGRDFYSIKHPIEPFVVVFSDNSLDLNLLSNGENSQDVSLQEGVREIIEDFQDQHPVEHNPDIIIKINLYHREKARGLK